MPQAHEAPTRPTTTAARYDSILVHVQPALATSRRTEIAAALARRFDARLIGVGAEQLEPFAAMDPYSAQMVAEAYAALQEQLLVDLASAEHAFRRDGAEAELEWRRVEGLPLTAMLAAARAADLIITGGHDEFAQDAYRGIDVGDLVLTSGRPVLVAPAGGAHLRAKSIVVAWKETREARRAIADALPFLQAADEVVVQAVCSEDEAQYMQGATRDVAEALRRKGAPARGAVTTAPDASVVDELNAEAAAIGADLIVSGAYGHSRLREVVLGGVTRDLLRNPQRYVLLSH